MTNPTIEGTLVDELGIQWRTLSEAAPFGWCYECGAPVTMRQQVPGSKDLCVNGHLHWSPRTLLTPPETFHGTT